MKSFNLDSIQKTHRAFLVKDITCH